MSATKTLAVIGASEETVAHLRLLMKLGARQLQQTWVWGAEAAADFVAVEVHDLGAQGVISRCQSAGVPCAVMAEANEVVVHGLVLRRPFKLDQIVADNDLPNPYDLIFLEVTVTDPSDFESRLEVRGITQHKKYRVLEVESPSVPNAIAAILLYIRDVSGVRPHIYFEWTEGNPLGNLAKFLLFGMVQTHSTLLGWGAAGRSTSPRPSTVL